MKTKTFTLKVNYPLAPFRYDGGKSYENGYSSIEIIKQLTQQANLCLGQGKWHANHFQALEKEKGDIVFKMRVVFGDYSRLWREPSQLKSYEPK